MGMRYMVLFKEKLNPSTRQIIQTIIDETFKEIDSTLNHWNNNSEISKWNHSTSTKPISISPLFLKAIRIADKAYTLTNGKYDPALGRATHQWKTSLRLGKFLSHDEIELLKKSCGWDKVIIKNNTLQKNHCDLKLDLDGLTKGLLCDILSEKIQRLHFNNFLVEWSGEIKCVGGPFKILVDKEINSLSDLSIATSGTLYQSYQITKNKKITTYSHFINPKTLTPFKVADLEKSKSVTHKSCSLADALATSNIIP
ncbi:MAG: FAD:protein FMN transferase [Chlamydiia bacterium]|nr:FAD:protein FMN transferase [Chlamydiia bacterium]